MDDPAHSDLNGPTGNSRVLRAVLMVVTVALLGAAAWWLFQFLSSPTGQKKPGVQQVAILRQPPPPPPKPPEKPPEPPKLKEEVKIDQPPPTPQPNEPKVADDKPASDKPLGVDAEGGAGNDGFGLAGNKGGRDLLTTGGGSGSYYSGLLQRHFFDALSRNRRILREEFRVVVRVWLGDDGRVQRAEIVNGSGNEQTDQLIQATLMDISPLREVPPAAMRPMQLRLSNRS